MTNSDDRMMERVARLSDSLQAAKDAIFQPGQDVQYRGHGQRKERNNGQDPCKCGQWRQFYGHEPEWEGKVVGLDWENLVGHPFAEDHSQ